MGNASESKGHESPSVRFKPAVIIVLLAVTAVVTLFTVPFDDLIQSWHRVVWSGGVLLAAWVALAIWLFRGSRISRPTRRRIVMINVVSLTLLIAVFRVRGYDGDMFPILAQRGWVSFCFTLVSPTDNTGENVLADATDLETTARELAARGDRANDSPDFLGPGRKPVFNVRLDPDWVAHPPEELWRRPAGEGFSSFVVVGSLAITQLQQLSGEDQGEAIVCFNLETGQLLWRHTDDVHFTSGLGGNGPRATPTIDGELVYTVGATGMLNCLRLTTGEKVWSRDLIADDKAKLPMWGMSGSPLVVDEMVVVTGGDQGDGGTHGILLAYNKKTGEPVWQGLGKDNASYGSPQLATVAGVRQIMVFAATTIVGYEAASGKQLWSYPWPGSMPNVAQVIALDENRVFASKGYATGSVVLDLASINSEGVPKEVWRERALMKTKFTNAVFRDGYAYGLSDGRLECIDVERHKRQWKVRAGYGQGQVLLVGDHLLIQADSGDVALVNVNPEKHEEVARFSPLSARTWNYPVIVGDRLLVRNDLEIACYRLKLAE